MSGFLSLSLCEPYKNFLTALHTGFKLMVAEGLGWHWPDSRHAIDGPVSKPPPPDALAPSITMFQCLGLRTDGLVGLHVDQVKLRRLGSTENNNLTSQ